MADETLVKTEKIIDLSNQEAIIVSRDILSSHTITEIKYLVKYLLNSLNYIRYVAINENNHNYVPDVIKLCATKKQCLKAELLNFASLFFNEDNFHLFLETLPDNVRAIWIAAADKIFFGDTISLVISQNILVLLQRVGYFEYYILTCLNRITNSYYNVLSLLNTSMIRAQNSVLRSTNRNIRLLLYRRNVFIRLSSSNYIHIIFRNEFLLCCKISIYWDDYQRQYDDKHSSWRQYVSQHSLCP